MSDDDLSSIINKSKLVNRLREKIMNLEDQNVDLKSRLKKLDSSQSAKTITKAPSIHIEGHPVGTPSENQIVDSEKYKHLMNERDKLKEYKEKAEAEKKKMNSELDLLRKLVSQRNIDKEAEWEIIGEKMKEITSEKELLEREKVTHTYHTYRHHHQHNHHPQHHQHRLYCHHHYHDDVLSEPLYRTVEV
jgi:putative cell wall-binding protein